MGVIYKVTNLINKKVYIGQTIDLEQRKRNHKSESYNQKSSGYKYAFHSAIRKYGWDNFVWEILEEVTDDLDEMNARERYYIALFNSYYEGYNETFGGEGNRIEKKTFQECCKSSKILNEEEIRDIQQMLIDGYQNNEILKKYPKLSRSLLNNINIGYNFKRTDIQYPLSPYHSLFDKKTQDEIIQKIKDKESYSSISKQYHISIGLISLINQGKQWNRKNETYPLAYKTCADNDKGENIQKDLIYSTMSFKEIAKKYNVSYAAVQAINSGRNRHNKTFKYPLRKNSDFNQTI